MKNVVMAIFFLLSINSFAQEKPQFNFLKKNSVQLDLGGPGLLYSIGYERIILNGSRFKTAGKIGAAYYPPALGFIEVWLPVSVSEIISFGNHHAEVGIGYTFVNDKYTSAIGEESRKWDGFITPNLSYRYQKPQGRFIFKAGVTPFFERYADSYDMHFSGGVVFGYAF